MLSLGLPPLHKNMAKGMLWVAFFVLVGRLAGAGKEIIIAYRFGASAELDAYLYVLNLVNLPVSILLSALLGVLVPLRARIESAQLTHFPRFRAELLGLTILCGLPLGILAWLGLPELLQSDRLGLPAATVLLTYPDLPLLALLIPLGMLISLFSSLVVSRGRHVNTLLEGIPALFLACSVFFLPSADIHLLVYATFAGFLCHVFGLMIALRKHEDLDKPKFSQTSTEWPLFWSGFGIVIIGQVFMNVVGVIDQFFAAHLEPGSLASLSYANRILAFILGLGSIAIGRVALPLFSHADAVLRKQILLHWGIVLFCLGALLCGVAWLFAPWAVHTLYERGAFDASDSLIVVKILRFGLLQLPFHFCGILFAAFLTSQQLYSLLAGIAFLNVLLKLLFNSLFTAPFAVAGLMLSTSLMLSVSCLLLAAVSYWKVHSKE